MRFQVSLFALFLAVTNAKNHQHSSAFQVHPWGLRQKLEGPDDIMKDMHGEMMRHNTNYDLSFNNSPQMGMASEIFQAMGKTHEATSVSNPIQAEDVVSPWPIDDSMRDTASEWDLLGTNYDYSFNQSPTENRCKETELRTKLQKQQTQAAQTIAQLDAELLVQNVRSWDKDGWERWMSLSKGGPDRGEQHLGVYQSAKEESKSESEPNVEAPTESVVTQASVAAHNTRSYLDSL